MYWFGRFIICALWMINLFSQRCFWSHIFYVCLINWIENLSIFWERYTPFQHLQSTPSSFGILQWFICQHWSVWSQTFFSPLPRLSHRRLLQPAVSKEAMVTHSTSKLSYTTCDRICAVAALIPNACPQLQIQRNWRTVASSKTVQTPLSKQCHMARAHRANTAGSVILFHFCYYCSYSNSSRTDLIKFTMNAS